MKMEQTYSFAVKNFESTEITTEKRINIDEKSNKPFTQYLPPREIKVTKNNDVFDEIGSELGEIVLGMTEYWKKFNFLDIKSSTLISSEIIRLSLKNVKIIETPIEIEEDDKKDIEFDDDF